jgi:hypothetical protein
MRWPKTPESVFVPFDLTAAYDGRILSGIPYAGVPYHDISPEPGKASIRAGLVAQIAPHGGTPWIGNFERGGNARDYLSGIAHTPDPRVALVMASGQGYFVRVDDPAAWKSASRWYASDIILLRQREWFIFASEIGLDCYSAQGDFRWGGRLVVDDLRVTHVEGDIIRGQGEIDLRFEVDVVSGHCTYIGQAPPVTWWDYPPGRTFIN